VRFPRRDGSLACRRLLLGELAAPSQGARINRGQSGTESLVSTESFLKTGVWLTESCQDFPDEGGLGLGDTVRIFRPNTREHNYVGLVGCQDPASPGKICLEGLKGCYEPKDLRPANSLVFTLHTLSDAVGQIFGAIKSDVKVVWKDLKLSLSAFGGFASSKITMARYQIAEQSKKTAQQFDKAAVRTKSLLVILVDSAVERWGKVKEGIRSVAETTMAKLVKIANYLSEKVSDFYDAHLTDIVEALNRYLGGIAAAVVDVPDELNPLASGGANQRSPSLAELETGSYPSKMGPNSSESEMDPWRAHGPEDRLWEDAANSLAAEEPSGLTQAIEGFMDKVGELGAKLVEFSRDVYETVAEGLGALMSGTGRLIAAASSRFSRVKVFVQQLASDAVPKMQEWGRQAAEFASDFDLKEFAVALWASVQEDFRKAMDAVHRGHTFVKQSLSAVADSLADSLAVAAESMLEAALWGSSSIMFSFWAVWESDAVQSTLDHIKREIQKLKKLLSLSLGLVRKFVGGIVKAVGRFIPRAVKDKFKAAANKAKDSAKKIQEDIAELVGTLTHGETKAIEVSVDTITPEA